MIARKVQTIGDNVDVLEITLSLAEVGIMLGGHQRHTRAENIKIDVTVRIE